MKQTEKLDPPAAPRTEPGILGQVMTLAALVMLARFGVALYGSMHFGREPVSVEQLIQKRFDALAAAEERAEISITQRNRSLSTTRTFWLNPSTQVGVDAIPDRGVIVGFKVIAATRR